MLTAYITFHIATLILFVNSYVDERDNVRQEIHQYFNSGIVKDFGTRFNKYRVSLETALRTTLTDTVGMQGMNIYINRNDKEYKCGYIYFDLGKVQVILSDLYLERLPRLETFDVFLTLDNNVMTLKGALSKIIVQGNYQAFRNSSDVVYAVDNVYPTSASLFLYQEVLPMGQLVVTLDDCHVDHNILAVLRGESVHFDYDTVPLRGCRYTVEIFQHDFGSPPVIYRGNPFVDVGESLDQYSVDWLVSKPLFEELETKTQAAGYSFINTTNILGEDLARIRQTQYLLISKTNQFVSYLVRNSKKEDDGSLELEDHTLSWDDSPEEKSGRTYTMTLTDMVLTGLNTIYSTNNGCPFKFGNPYVKIHLRFNSVQVRGKVLFKKTDTSLKEPAKSSINFVSTFEDLDLYVTLNLDPTGDSADFVFHLGTFQRKSFSVPDIVFDAMESLINGYLQQRIFVEIKTRLREKLISAFSPLYSNKKYNPQTPSKETIPPECQKYVQSDQNPEPPEIEPSDDNHNEEPQTTTDADLDELTENEDAQVVHLETDEKIESVKKGQIVSIQPPHKSNANKKDPNERVRLYYPSHIWQAKPGMPQLDLHEPYRIKEKSG